MLSWANEGLEMHSIDAQFISGEKGGLFCLYRPPNEIMHDSECFVLAPPFAEEMNRSRYMCTLFSQEITSQGHGYLSVDPYGTGDSAGDFEDAEWNLWCNDLMTTCEYARSLGYQRISLFGIRLGALLALQVADQIDGLQRLVFWNPVVSGKTTLTQFLRIRIAASLEREEEATTVAQFVEQIDQGKSVQVAGYDISPGLFNGIMSASLEHHLDLIDIPVLWINTLASEERKVPRVEINLEKKWRANGGDITLSTVIGPSFWAAHERSLATDLVSATIDYISGVREVD